MRLKALFGLSNGPSHELESLGGDASRLAPLAELEPLPTLKLLRNKATERARRRGERGLREPGPLNSARAALGVSLGEAGGVAMLSTPIVQCVVGGNDVCSRKAWMLRARQ